MKKLLLLPLLALLFLQCQDTKKPSVNEEITKNTPPKDSVLKTKKTASDAPNKKKYPVITQENVISFLSQYGKKNQETLVEISTKYGPIIIRLFKETPLHRANFIYLVKQGYFDNTYFHRVVKGFIIQGGNADDISVPKKRKKIGNSYRLPYEKGTGQIHTYGTVSGAKEYRENPDNMSAPFEFFIFLGKQSQTNHLNGNYTVFGKVIKGMDVVKKISELPADEGDWPLYNVYIKAKVIE
jgi:peptidylprolyl isomerase